MVQISVLELQETWGCQLGMDGHDLDRVAVGQLRQDIDEQAQGRGGNLDRVGVVILIIETTC